MNKRQKKKLYKNSLIKIKKLHPKQGDVICFMPNLYKVDMDVIVEFLHTYDNLKVFGKAPIVIVPCNIKTMDKEVIESFCDKMLAVVREDGE